MNGNKKAGADNRALVERGAFQEIESHAGTPADLVVEELEQRLEMQALMDADLGADYGPKPKPPTPPPRPPWPGPKAY
jgi:hypothetical protein